MKNGGPKYEIVPLRPEDYYPGGPGGVALGRFILETDGNPSRYDAAEEIVRDRFPGAYGQFTMRVMRPGEKLEPSERIYNGQIIYPDGSVVTNIGLDPIRN